MESNVVQIKDSQKNRATMESKESVPVKSNADEELLDKIAMWQEESSIMLESYTVRWVDNLKLVFGIFKDNDNQTSRVRQRNKTYFRKIWSVVKRLVASVYSSLMKDSDSVKVVGRDNANDYFKAKVLQEIFEYRRDYMVNHQNLFLQHMWAFEDILDFGFCAGRLSWEFKPDSTPKVDRPTYKLYPPERCYPDLSAELSSEMKFFIFEDFLTLDEMKTNKFDNIDECEIEAVPYDDIRAIRYNIHKDPMQSFSENEYPAAGSGFGDKTEQRERALYRVWTVFYTEEGKRKLVITNGDKVVLRKPKDDPYDGMGIVFGQCLTVPHRLIGEGMPEPLESPQESYNYNLNIRKDNVALCLNSPTIVSRFANVDLNSLVNSRAGGVVLSDDSSENAVRKLQIGDVTQSSYAEAQADDNMIQEMSGVTSEKMGMGAASQKATTSQINYLEGNEKIGLLLAMIGETYWREFHYKLIYLIQKFETDENVIRVANASFRQKDEVPAMIPHISSIDDFDADIQINIGPTDAGKQKELQDTFLAMDRASMYNQQLALMLQNGVVKAGEVKFVNIQSLMEDVLPYLGKKSEPRYFIQAQPPPPPPAVQGAGGQPPALAGQMQPQQGNLTLPTGPTPNQIRMPGLHRLPPPA